MRIKTSNRICFYLGNKKWKSCLQAILTTAENKLIKKQAQSTQPQLQIRMDLIYKKNKNKLVGRQNSLLPKIIIFSNLDLKFS